MKTLVMSGVSLTDIVFTTDPEIFGEEICWNVTRIERDAALGTFGPPERIPMSRLPPLPDKARSNLDWPKIEAMVAALREGATPALLVPILQVLVQIGQTLYRIPIDGNHRLTAQRLFGLEFFECYVVPAEMEHRYRATVGVF